MTTCQLAAPTPERSGRKRVIFLDMTTPYPIALASAAALAVGGALAPAHGQGAQIIDQGSFTITTGGQRTGREEFRVTVQLVFEIADGPSAGRGR